MANKQEQQKILNYTAALLLAMILEKQKATIANIGLSLDGFYVDFDFQETLKAEELKILNKELLQLSKQRIIIREEKLTNQFSNNPFISDKLTKLTDEQKVVYEIEKHYFLKENAAYVLTNKVNFVNLLSVSGVYWQNNAANKQLQRIYGISAASKEELKKIINLINLRKEHDHRKIGQDLEIFTFNALAGSGLPIWLPKGMALKKTLQAYLRTKETEYDYLEVATPVLGAVALYHTSGHWDHYHQNMFPVMKLAHEELVLRPMSCPHHCLVYQYKPRSYRDLPLRIAEHELLYRYEASGALTGLERVRAMELTDAHIFCRFDQLKTEFKKTFKLIKETLQDLKISIDYYSLSLRDTNDKTSYYDNDLMWTKAETLLKEALDELGIEYQVMIGEAAFYGPKLDIQIKTVLAHDITVSTIQLDFLLPEKFDLTYQNKDGSLPRPVIIHRGLIGTYERFIAVLLEQTKGVLPFWLAPTQIAIIPISEDQQEYCEKIYQWCKQKNLRSIIDNRDDRLNLKIRNAQIKKIPFQIVIGQKEVMNEQVTYRQYGSDKQVTIDIDDFMKLCQQLVLSKE